MRRLRDAAALAKIAGLTGPPLGESFNICSLSSLMALSTTAFLLIFFGRPISSLIPRGSRDLSDLRLDKDDWPSTLTNAMLLNLRRDNTMMRASFNVALVWF